ncbi:pH regulation protein F [Candidatus Aerophobetes bacterium]|nr:pH regulation protein F [Candidatus Aerophobetes bacterium]
MDLNPLVLDIVIFALTGISVISMVRVIIGPTTEDRLIGLNLVVAQIVGIMVVVAVKFNRSIYLDVALVYAILGFVSILAIARYTGGKEVQK